MLLRVKESAICDIYIRTFLVYDWGKSLFCNVYQMPGTQRLLTGISNQLQAFKTQVFNI